MRKSVKIFSAFWLSLSCIASFAGVPLLTYHEYKDYNLSSYSEKDLQNILDNLVTSYKFLPPGKISVKVKLETNPTFNAYCNFEDKGSKEINITVYTGLLKELNNVNELAYILGHELSHSLLGHARFEDVYNENTVNSEALADLTGQQLTRIAGYDPGYASDTWVHFIAKEGDSGGLTHPKHSERVRILNTPKFWYNELYETTYNVGHHLDNLYNYHSWDVPKNPVDEVIQNIIVHFS